MEDSALPLTRWFTAIQVMLLRPDVSTTELARTLQIDRAATVRAMTKKIRAAMRADDASRKLAGLDAVFLPLI